MSTRDAGAVIIRLDLRGQEELKRRLEELGPAGKRLARDLEAAMQPVSQQGKLAKASLDEVSGAIRNAASEAGPFGRVLGGLGPIGLASAAALGVLALAVREVMQLMARSREVAAYAGGLDDTARAAGVSMSAVQALATTVQLAGGSFESGTQAMEQWAIRLGRVRALGQGETFDALRVLGISRADLDGMNAAQALDVVIERLMQIEDISTRLALADRLGLGGMSELLRRNAADARELAVQAERINAALGEETLRRMASMDALMTQMEGRRDLAQKAQASAFADMQLRMMEMRTAYDERIALLSQFILPLEERATTVLEQQAGWLQEIEYGWRDVGELIGPTGYIRYTQEAFRWTARLLGLGEEAADETARRADEAERAAEAAEREARALATLPQSGFRGPFADPDEAYRPDPGTVMALDRRRELESLVASSLRSLMTPLQQVAQLERDLNAAREEYLRTGEAGLAITEAEIDSILRLTRAQLGLNDAIKAVPDGKFDTEADARQRDAALERFNQQIELEAAQIRGDDARVQALEDQARLASLITAYQAEGFKIDEARARAAADLAALAEARAEAEVAGLDALRESHDLTIARLRRDTDRVAMLEREAAIRREMEQGVSRDVAETRADERAYAARVGEVRDMVEQGISSGLQAFVQTGDMAALGRGVAVSFVEYAADGLIETLSSQAADWLLGGFDAAAEGATQGAAASVPMSTAITTSGATAATAMGTAITTAGSAVAAQLAAAMAGGQGASLLGDVVKGAGLPGLDTGGRIRIGGRGGIDNNLLSINNRPVARVSADETIEVVPRLGGRGGAPVIVQRFVLDARNAVMTSELLAELQDKANESARAEAAQVAAEISGETVRRSRASIPSALEQQRALSG